MPRIVNVISIILFDPVRSYVKLITGVPRAMPAPTKAEAIPMISLRYSSPEIADVNKGSNTERALNEIPNSAAKIHAIISLLTIRRSTAHITKDTRHIKIAALMPILS